MQKHQQTYFEKRGKKDVSPELDQFLCHVAKTGETVVQWPQFKEYFLFKLEKVMDDFRTSAPEQRGPPNPNVEYIPFDEMKQRILKIVASFNGTPFTIQRLCELLTDPRRNYTGTDKFLRGVEKNIMVVSCVYPSSEKNTSPSLNRMNGVMFPSNSQSYTDRSNVNGPGTPRPTNRPKFTLSSPMNTNGLPDSMENKESDLQQKEKSLSDSAVFDDGSQATTPKNKHSAEDSVEAEEHEVKRLKFDTEEDEEAACANPDASSEVSTEMAEEAECASTSADKGKESCQTAQTADEESLMTASESTEVECNERDSETVSVSEESSEESHQMEESEQSESACSLNSEEPNSAAAAASTAGTDSSEGNIGIKSTEILSLSPMENSEEATNAPEEPMEQD
ncbi:serine/threonine-protein phosphatase 4 regulatory subunit 2-B isoform X1 [Xenopus laevis]|uniref:Serine/threonine-protein phosphatase 4 regulatory subunit 2-B isoform X1 n=1 Tax=Xenopus laevis TaxID=8355 RepID=A0A8J1N1G0_XENLA|nr:serine/threonine-protein phosphatase 4 regulatory subunit 2-B isoform X1 [Xenopus laevis]